MNNGDLKAFTTELKEKAVQSRAKRKTMEDAERKASTRSVALKAQGKGKRKGKAAIGNTTEVWSSSPSCPSNRATAPPTPAQGSVAMVDFKTAVSADPAGAAGLASPSGWEPRRPCGDRSSHRPCWACGPHRPCKDRGPHGL